MGLGFHEALQQRQSAAAMASVLPLACLLSCVTACIPALAETWEGRLQRGGQIIVDPYTHRAMRNENGMQRPMWDGVHRLDDGSAVIIRDGIAIPTEQMYQAWSEGGRPQPMFEERYCDQLVHKTCGFDNACNNSASCLRARTLLADEGREQREQPLTAGSYPLTATSELCRAALTDPAFEICSSLEAQIGGSRCRELVDRVCGERDRCAGTEPCSAARQLLRMETEERLINADPGALSGIGRQCLEAMGNAFFSPCEPQASPLLGSDSGSGSGSGSASGSASEPSPDQAPPAPGAPRPVD
jgi:hypothetical protein